MENLILDIRENKPKLGSVSRSCAQAGTGKARKTALFRSSGEYAL